MTHLTIAARILDAIDTDSAYFAKCLGMRNPGPDSQGSTFLTEQTVASVLTAAMAAGAREANDPNIQAPAVGFVLPIPGRLGLVDLTTVDPATPVTLEDPKSTGKVGATIVAESGDYVDFTTILLGPGKDGVEQVWTLFPGASVAPSEVDAAGRAGQIVTAAEAIALGLGLAKVVNGPWGD